MIVPSAPNITSLADLREILNQVSRDSGFFFRGEHRSNWELKPKIGRMTVSPAQSRRTGKLHVSQRYPIERVGEDELLKRFKSAAFPYLSQAPNSEWDWLALAQHHGLPTRLLDWTTNPLVALHFAVGEFVDSAWLERQRREHDGYDGSAAFYIMRIKQSLLDLDKVEPYKCTGMFFPSHVTPRIAAQGGLFSIQEDPHKELKFGRIRKHLVPFDARKSLREQLVLFGISHSFIYPGLDGIAKDLSERLNEF